MLASRKLTLRVSSVGCGEAQISMPGSISVVFERWLSLVTTSKVHQNKTSGPQLLQ